MIQNWDRLVLRGVRSSDNEDMGLAMVVMVTCKNCGHEYQSKLLQTPDEETLRSNTYEKVIENCPKCNQISSYNGPDFYWE
jgi:RNase P subunit RPR2